MGYCRICMANDVNCKSGCQILVDHAVLRDESDLPGQADIVKAKAFRITLQVGLLPQMHVHIDEVLHAGHLREICYLRAINSNFARAQGFDRVIFDDDSLCADKFCRFRIQHVATLERFQISSLGRQEAAIKTTNRVRCMAYSKNLLDISRSLSSRMCFKWYSKRLIN